jgi:hypothetical protein
MEASGSAEHQDHHHHHYHEEHQYQEQKVQDHRDHQHAGSGSRASTGAPSTFESFTVFELLHQPTQGIPAHQPQERRGLETRRMFASLAPQVTENPIYMHCTVSYFNGTAEAPEGLRQCIDQASAVGFEVSAVLSST